MEMILDNLKTVSASTNTNYNNLLKEAGFSVDVPGYQKITIEAIENYLEKLIKEFIIKQKYTMSEYLKGQLENREEGGYRLTCGIKNRKLTCVWVETDIEKFKCTPPKHVLKSIINAKKDFDKIKIVTIEEVFDPLVVGINENDPDRYLIDWWGKDIDPSGLVE